jgi:Tol biopolymer transport system component
MREIFLAATAGGVLALGPPSVVTVALQDTRTSPMDAPSVAVSDDGRFVAFASYAPLVPADTNTCRDIYVLDRADGRVTLESLAPDGSVSDVESASPGISGDGRLLVYETHNDVALRDRLKGVTRILAEGRDPSISRDGTMVAFVSAATNLISAPDNNGAGDDVYLMELGSGTIRRVSVNSSGAQPSSGSSIAPSVSGDGRYVAFASTAPLDSPSIGRKISQVYVRDTALNITRQISVDARGRSPDQPSWRPSMSADGCCVAFVSAATNLAGSDRNRSADVFIADLHTAAVELVSRGATGSSGNGASWNPAVSADGRFVAFQSEASDLICASRCTGAAQDINLLPDVFLFDRQTRTMRRLSEDESAGWMEGSAGPAISGAGSVIAFSSRHPIDAADKKNDFDLFVIQSGASRVNGALVPTHTGSPNLAVAAGP